MRGRSHRFFSGTRLVCLFVVAVAVLYAYQQFTVPAEPTFVRILPRLPLLLEWGDTRLDTLRLLLRVAAPLLWLLIALVAYGIMRIVKNALFADSRPVSVEPSVQQEEPAAPASHATYPVKERNDAPAAPGLPEAKEAPALTDAARSPGVAARAERDEQSDTPPEPHQAKVEPAEEPARREDNAWLLDRAAQPAPTTGSALAALEEMLRQSANGAEAPVGSGPALATPQEAARPTGADVHQAERPGRLSVAEHAGTGPVAPVQLSFLGEARMELVGAGGERIPVSLEFSKYRCTLLAYLATLAPTLSQAVKRDKLLEDIFGFERKDEEADVEKLGDLFSQHAKKFRRHLRELAEQANAQAGSTVIPPEIMLFDHVQGEHTTMWFLTAECTVLDLPVVERWHRAMLEAGQYTAEEQQACQRLREAYSGDFLAKLVEERRVGKWAMTPFTLYRDYYLEALWREAEYWHKLLEQGGQVTRERLADELRPCVERAASLYQQYALHALRSRFDLKVRPDGLRLPQSERAVRRAARMYRLLGNPQAIDSVVGTYRALVKRHFSMEWKPTPETQAELQRAQENSGAFFLPLQDS